MLDDPARRAEWHRYYSDKRIVQQWKQFDLVGRYHKGGAILEIGPNLGLVTACLVNAGYLVDTLDLGAAQFAAPAVGHITADLRTLDPKLVAKYDTILCCEMLEHIRWEETDGVLARLIRRDRRLIVSVPYEGFQIFFQGYLNRHTARHMFQWRKLRGMRDFAPGPDDQPETHKWEVGYRGHSLARWESKLRQSGWRILAREFTSPTRSVFHVLAADEASVPHR